MEKAIIDRIVDGKHAVLLVGDHEEERIVSIDQLPEGAIEGVWVIIKDNGKFEIDNTTTTKVQSNVKSKLEMLRERSQKSNYKY